MKKATFIKLSQPNGWDFYTGKTINYRESIGKTVICPNGDPKLGICTRGVIHASVNPNDCFIGASIPCSAYRVEGKPVCGNERKYGFLELNVVEEIIDLNNLFSWNYIKACNPITPLRGRAKKPSEKEIELLMSWASAWASVRASVWDSVRASVRDSVWASIGDSARDSVWASVRASVRDSVGDSVEASAWASVRASIRASVEASAWASVEASVGASVEASVRDSVWAYIGSLFPNIKEWKYIDHKKSDYPFQSAVDLWKRGFVPSFDGKTWRLHSGKSAVIVYE